MRVVGSAWADGRSSAVTDLPATAPIGAGEIGWQTLALLRLNSWRCLLTIVLMTAVGVSLDAGWANPDQATGLELLLAILTLWSHYWLTRSSLLGLDLVGNAPPRFPAFFLLMIGSGVSVAIGFLALIVPGLVLLIRWSVSVPILVGSRETVLSALRLSWSMTRGLFWPIVFILVPIILAPFIMTGLWFWLLEGEVPYLATWIVTNLGLNLALVAGWHAAVAILYLLSQRTHWDDVFA